jgi:hypothetical protein
MDIEIDISDADRELDRLIRGFDDSTNMAFDSVMAAQFQETQAYVHVQTGSLRASATMDSNHGDKKWKGEIEYGGPSGGFPNDPVDYAEYEYERGGSHDFLTPAKLSDDSYVEPILDFFRG